MRFAVRVGILAWLALQAAACGNSGSSGEIDGASLDGTPEHSDVPDTPDGSDVPGDELDAGEIELPEVTDVDGVDTTPPPGPYVLACEDDADCRVACGQGSCDDASRRCVFVPKPGQCVLPVPGDVALVDCFAAGAGNPQLGCLFCQPGVAQDRWSAAAWFDDLETAATPLAISDATNSGVRWHRSSRRSSSGAWSLYLGTDAGDYQAALPVDSTASLALDLPDASSVALRFDLWLETEGTAGYDVLTVGLDATDGSHVLFTSDSLNGDTGGRFARQELDVTSWAGQKVTLRLRFETLDAKINQFEGAYVDRLGVWTGCCGANVECDDLDPCTKEHCSDDQTACVRFPLTGCCATAVDCDDDDPCTLDSCPVPGEGCQHVEVPECCATTADCDDGEPCTDDTCPLPGGDCRHLRTCCTKSSECVDDDPCTKGLCQAGACRYLDTCCHADADCDDGELCTRDTCLVDGACEHKPAHLPGCCLPEIYEQHFDLDAGGFEFSGGSGNVGWHHVTDSRSKSAPGALYYGDPETDSYDDGSGGDDWWYDDYWGYGNEGDAKGPAVLLPMGVEITLSFALWIEAEDGYDKLTVFVDDGTEEFAVWKSDSSTPESIWTSVSVDLSALAGREIRLRLYFSCDGYGFYEGVYVDDLRYTTSCGPHTCDANGDCPAWGDCRDGGCVGGLCVFEYLCCSTSEECDDDDVCTTDGCVGGKCRHDRTPGCCTSVFDCDDGNPCTADGCPGEGLQCTHVPIDGCCLSDAECGDGDSCSFDWCRANVCSHAPSCCASDTDCDDGDDACTSDRCVGGTCSYVPTWLPECCYPVPFFESFEGTNAFTFTGGTSTVGWHVTSGLAPAPEQTVLYFGDPDAFSYWALSSNEGSALSTPFLLPPGSDLGLSFDFWQHTEGSYYWDYTEVFVVFGDHEARVWAKAGDTPQQEWTTIEVDLSAFGGLEVRLRVHFAADSSVSYEGVLLDNLRVTSSCGPKSCTADAGCPAPEACFDSRCVQGACAYERLCCTTAAECDDGDPCTDDTCNGSTCSHVPNKACCTTAADCDDAEACTVDTCPVPGGGCLFTWVPGCCHVDAHCDDGLACTSDRCVDGACSHADVCCMADADCDDSDACTADACADGFCGHVPTGAEGCCQPDLLVETFGDVDLPGWSFVDREGSLGWQVVSDGPWLEGEGALYFGDPATWSYDTGARVAESAVLAGVTLFAGVPWHLSFRVNADVGDPGDAFDRLVVEVVDGDARYTAWSKDDLPAVSTWTDATIDLSAFAGRTVALAFRFDSVDGLNNVGAGVLVDDVAVTSPCLPRLCSGPALCRDGLAASKDLCVGGECAYELP